jgi:hypothetical protein
MENGSKLQDLHTVVYVVQSLQVLLLKSLLITSTVVLALKVKLATKVIHARRYSLLCI